MNGINKYEMIWTISFLQPVYSIHVDDINGDGIREILVVTKRAIILLQVRIHFISNQKGFPPFNGFHINDFGFE